MSRPTTKAELLAAATQEFERLWAQVDELEVADRDLAGCCESWSVKDLLAHLDTWHELLLGWQQAADAGTTPAMPAPGYSWKDTPALNQAIFERRRDDSWADVERCLRLSHDRVLALIGRYDDDDLFAKRRFSWTGSTSVGSYLVSTTSSHYAWASGLVRKWAKTRKSAVEAEL